MEESVKASIVWATALVLVIVSLSFVGMRGCEADRKAFEACVERTQKPLECRAAMGGTR